MVGLKETLAWSRRIRSHIMTLRARGVEVNEDLEYMVVGALVTRDPSLLSYLSSLVGEGGTPSEHPELEIKDLEQTEEFRDVPQRERVEFYTALVSGVFMEARQQC